MGRAVKNGDISREQGADAIKLFLKVTQSGDKKDSILELKAQRARAQIGVATLKYHLKSTKIGSLPKKERKAKMKELVANFEIEAKITDAEIYESATDERFQNKPEDFIKLMDEERVCCVIPD